MINGEGGRIAEENRVDYVMDMAETTATVWLGLTTNCCRCHDHKFDPLTQRDYYKLFAFFDQTPVTGGGGNPQTPPVLDRPTDAQRKDIAEVEEKIADVKKRIDVRTAELAAGQATWKPQLVAAGGTQWQVLKPASAKAAGQTLTIRPDNSVLASGANPANDTYTVTAPIDAATLNGIRLRRSAWRSEPEQKRVGPVGQRQFRAHGVRGVAARPRASRTQAAEVRRGRAASFEQGSFPVAAAFDGNPKTGWAVWAGIDIDRDHEAIFKLAEPAAAGPGAFLTLTLRHDSPHVSHNIGHFRLAVTGDPAPKLGGYAEPFATALRVPVAERSKEQAELLAKSYHETDDDFRMLAAERQKYDQQLTDTRKAVVKVMVMADMPTPRKTFMLDRGLYNKPGEEVFSGVPASLPPLAGGAPQNRLGLAQWLVSADQPLTARVTVNRFWQQLFGVGLVKTTEDFGVQGEMPKHLELLDWLAADFRESGWNVKGLIRRIVTSHAYRQSSKVSRPNLRKTIRRIGCWAQARAPHSSCILDVAGPSFGRRRTAGGPRRRAAGQRLPAARRVGRGDLWPQNVQAGSWRRALPPQPVHVLAADHRAHDVLRQRLAPDLHGESFPHQHAAACAADA